MFSQALDEDTHVGRRQCVRGSFTSIDQVVQTPRCGLILEPRNIVICIGVDSKAGLYTVAKRRLLDAWLKDPLWLPRYISTPLTDICTGQILIFTSARTKYLFFAQVPPLQAEVTYQGGRNYPKHHSYLRVVPAPLSCRGAAAYAESQTSRPRSTKIMPSFDRPRWAAKTRLGGIGTLMSWPQEARATTALRGGSELA